MANLDERFRDFMESKLHAEPIDLLPVHPEHARRKKADYFFQARDVIIELKTICDDRQRVVDSILEELRQRPDWPVFFERRDLQEVLRDHPMREEINRHLFDKITSSVEGLYKSANKQIRETKVSFDVPESQGLLVVVNDVADLLTPDALQYKLRALWQKKTSSGDRRFPEIKSTIVISDTHTAVGPTGQAWPLALIVTDDGIRVDGLLDTAEEFLLISWAGYNNMPYVPCRLSEAGQLAEMTRNKMPPAAP